MTYPSLSECQLGFIGAGNMALAMVKGFLKSGQLRADQMCVSAPTDRNLNKFKELGCFTTNKNNEIFSQFRKIEGKITKVLFLCVKPNIFKTSRSKISATSDLSDYQKEAIIVISVMAGITINQIRDQINDFLGHQIKMVKIARLMPNTAATVGAGICGIAVEDDTDQPFKDFLRLLLSPIGLCEFVAQHLINAVCGMGGSGIAFVYSLIHAMSDGGLKMGLPRSVSNNIAAQTVLGAALMVLETEKNPIVLRDEVTSPGGTTIHGLHALEKGAFNSVIIDAIEAATERANQLS